MANVELGMRECHSRILLLGISTPKNDLILLETPDIARLLESRSDGWKALE